MALDPYVPTYYDRMLGKTFSEMMSDMGYLSTTEVEALGEVITKLDGAETAKLSMNKIWDSYHAGGGRELFEAYQNDYMYSYYANTLKNGTTVGGNIIEEVTLGGENLSVSTKTAKVATAVDVGTYTAEGTEYAAMKGVGKTATGTAVKGTSTFGSYVFGEVLPFVGAVATGVEVGLAIDKAVYEAHPDWWWYNVENWDNILLGHDSMLPVLHDGSSGKSYISEEAYLNYMLAYHNLGAFNATGDWNIPDNPILWRAPDNTELQLLTHYAVTGPCTITYSYETNDGSSRYEYIYQIHGNVLWESQGSNNWTAVILEGTSPKTTGSAYTEHYTWIRNGVIQTESTSEHSWGNNRISRNGAVAYWSSGPSGSQNDSPPVLNNVEYSGPRLGYTEGETQFTYNTIVFAINGNPNIATEQQPVTGISIVGNTPSDYTNVRTSYPDLWNNRVTTNGIDKDGNSVTINWLPVALPNTEDMQEEMQKIINAVKGGDKTVFDEDAQTEVDSEGASQSDDGSYDDDDAKNKAKVSTAFQAIINMLNDTAAKVADKVSGIGGIDMNNPTPTPTNPSGVGDTEVPIVPAGSISNGMCMVYNPTRSELVALSRFLWSTNFFDLVEKLFASPMDGIIGIHELYVTPSVGGRANIVCGYVDSEVESNYVDARYATIDCGSVKIEELYGNIFDYDYTDLELFLPFVGFVNIDIGEAMRGTVKVNYTVDVLTGACLARVNIERDTYLVHAYSFGGNCAAQVPYSAGTNSMIFSAICGAINGFMTGGPAGALAGSVGTAITQGKKTVEKGGGWGPNINSMDDKKPFILLKSNMSAMPTQYSNWQGYPLHQTASLGMCKGFTKATNIHYSGSATAEEVEEIENLLEKGVIM